MLPWLSLVFQIIQVLLLAMMVDKLRHIHRELQGQRPHRDRKNRLTRYFED